MTQYPDRPQLVQPFHFEGIVAAVQHVRTGLVVKMNTSYGAVTFIDNQRWNEGANMRVYGDVYEITFEGVYKIRPFAIFVE